MTDKPDEQPEEQSGGQSGEQSGDEATEPVGWATPGPYEPPAWSPVRDRRTREIRKVSALNRCGWQSTE